MQEFPTGSIYNFVLSTENCIGPLTYLRIWHDNTGKGKYRGWFLDQIQVTDIQTGEKYVNQLKVFILGDYNTEILQK